MLKQVFSGFILSGFLSLSYAQLGQIDPVSEGEDCAIAKCKKNLSCQAIKVLNGVVYRCVKEEKVDKKNHPTIFQSY